jgi:D-alanyl-D-alanine carboxypeptidase
MNKYVDIFVDVMNKTSELIGMNDSVWVNPSGLKCNKGYSRSSCYDLAILASTCYRKSPIIRSIWSSNLRSYVMNFRDRSNNKISKTIESTFHYNVFDNKYPIFGYKTGGGDGYHVLVAITMIHNKTVCCVVYGTKTADERFDAMLELFDVVSRKRDDITLSTNAVCIDVMTNEIIFDKGCHEYIKPMSTTKMMTLFIAMRYNKDLDTEVSVISDDGIGTYRTSGHYFNVGDVVSIRDLVYAALLPSSNQAANILARITGMKIIECKK